MGTSQSSPMNVPPRLARSHYLGMEHDFNFNENLYHDCGAGTLVNNYYLQTFCDSYTTSDRANGTLQSFTHNTMAYLGLHNTSDTTDIYQFGGRSDQNHGHKSFQSGVGAIELQWNESGLALWPWGAMTTLPHRNTAIAIYGVNTPSGNESYYTSLVAIMANDPHNTSTGIGNNLPTHRLVKQLFYSNEIQYGNLGLTISNDSKTLYLWASVSQGMKLARAPLTTLSDRSTYTYWNAKSRTWLPTPPPAGDTSSNAITFCHSSYVPLAPSSGTVFFSTHHRTFLAVFMDNSIAGTFWIQYSSSGNIEGPWIDAGVLYTVPREHECDEDGLAYKWYYAGWPHPGLDLSGRSLVVSWSACGPFVEMSRLVWA